MGLSFMESMESIKATSASKAEVSKSPIVSQKTFETDVDTQIVALDVTGDNWTRNTTIYEWDDEYHDVLYSSVDKSKNITVDSSQVSVTQEKNSQYIPFTLARYWDGVDLSQMTFVIHGVNKNKEEFRDVPINFEYNDTSIRFGWLMSEYACSVSGELQFEIEAYGVNKKNKDYKWITRPNGKLNIIQSLCGSKNGTIQPSDDWMTAFINQVTEKVSEAQEAAQEAQTFALEAQNAVSQANDAAAQAQVTVENAKNELRASLNELITTALSEYYTSDQIDHLLENIDLTEIYKKIDSIDGLANFKHSYDPETRVLTFYNGETAIGSETLNSDPTADWVSTYNGIVDGKISDAVSNISFDLSDYKNRTDGTLQLYNWKSMIFHKILLIIFITNPLWILYWKKKLPLVV